MIQSITPSGFFGNSSDNIVVLPGAITEEERITLLEVARNISRYENATVEAWKDRVAGASILDADFPGTTRIITAIQERIRVLIEEKFNCVVVPTGPSIVRWTTGHVQAPHADKEEWQEPNVGKPNHSPHYDFGNITYLNDDYDGGVLYFPQHDLSFKPEAGTSAFFPGDRNYLHGVTRINSGVRYTLPTFWTIVSHNDSTN